MPTYTYRCATCGHQFDIFQKFADDPLKECPECHGALKKVLHPVGVVFKGSGWYINDSRPAQPSENGGADKSEKSDKSDKSDKSEKSDKIAAKDSKSGDTTKAASSESTSTTTAKSESKPKAAASSEQ
jgi:putative FmdB family regulatory protein